LFDCLPGPTTRPDLRAPFVSLLPSSASSRCALPARHRRRYECLGSLCGIFLVLVCVLRLFACLVVCFCECGTLNGAFLGLNLCWFWFWCCARINTVTRLLPELFARLRTDLSIRLLLRPPIHTQVMSARRNIAFGAQSAWSVHQSLLGDFQRAQAAHDAFEADLAQAQATLNAAASGAPVSAAAVAATAAAFIGTAPQARGRMKSVTLHLKQAASFAGSHTRTRQTRSNSSQELTRFAHAHICFSLRLIVDTVCLAVFQYLLISRPSRRSSCCCSSSRTRHMPPRWRTRRRSRFRQCGRPSAGRCWRTPWTTWRRRRRRRRGRRVAKCRGDWTRDGSRDHCPM
jgi:hypothetical protein